MPKKLPYRKIVFSQQPGDETLPDDRDVNRASMVKLHSSRFKADGMKITAAGAQRATAGARSAAKSAPAASPERVNVFSKFGDIAPYVSNIANSFRKAPRPEVPGSINPVGMKRLNFDAQRAETDRAVRGADNNAHMYLDENTATAVQSGNLASSIRAKNSIAENESNANSELAMRNDQLNASIESQNVQMFNQYKNDVVGARIADQREQSANLSNAADKYIGQQQFKDAQQLDMDKWNAYQPLFNQSGVARRAYGDKFAGGGELSVIPRRKVFGSGFALTGGSASVGTTGRGWRTPNAGYDWSNNGMGKSSPTWESFDTKRLTNAQRLQRENDMKFGNMVDFFKNNNPSSNVYEGRPENMHYSITPNTPVLTDRPTYASYGGRLRKRVY